MSPHPLTTRPALPAPTDEPVPALGWVHVPLLLLGPVALTVAGLFHPAHLTTDSAEQWRVLHVVMLPLFPLLGLTMAMLVRGDRSPVAVLVRLAAFTYACFYTALDVLAGIANGAIVRAADGADVDGPKAVVFGQGNDLAAVGVWAMVATVVLLGVVHLRRSGLRSLPGTAVLLVSAWSFLDSHVYPPRGVITMLGFGLGALLLALPLLRDRAHVPDPPTS